MKTRLILMTAALAASTASPARADTCKVVEGTYNEISPGPYLPAEQPITLKSNFTAEFKWSLDDKESMGWMRILDDRGVEIGWVPAGHEAVRCGSGN